MAQTVKKEKLKKKTEKEKKKKKTVEKHYGRPFKYVLTYNWLSEMMHKPYISAYAQLEVRHAVGGSTDMEQWSVTTCNLWPKEKLKTRGAFHILAQDQYTFQPNKINRRKKRSMCGIRTQHVTYRTW